MILRQDYQECLCFSPSVALDHQKVDDDLLYCQEKNSLSLYRPKFLSISHYKSESQT
jgi:hypothetical protein